MPRRPELAQRFDKYGYPIPAAATSERSGYRSVSTPVPRNGHPSGPDLDPDSGLASKSRSRTSKRKERYEHPDERQAPIPRQGHRTPLDLKLKSRADDEPDQGYNNGGRRYGGRVDLPRLQRLEEDGRQAHRSEHDHYYSGLAREQASNVAQHDLEDRLSRLRKDRPDVRAGMRDSRSGGGKLVPRLYQAETGFREGHGDSDHGPGLGPVQTRLKPEANRPDARPETRHSRSSSDHHGRKETKQRPPGSRKTSVTFAPLLETDIEMCMDIGPGRYEQQEGKGRAGRAPGDSRRDWGGFHERPEVEVKAERPKDEVPNLTPDFRGNEERVPSDLHMALNFDPRSDTYDHSEYLRLQRHSDVGLGSTEDKPRMRTRYPPSSALLSPLSPASRVLGHDQGRNSRSDTRRMGSRSISTPIRSPTTGSITPAPFCQAVREPAETRFDSGRFTAEQNARMRQNRADAREMDAKTDGSTRNLGIGHPPRSSTMEDTRYHPAQDKGKSIDRAAQFDPVWQKEEELRQMVRETAQVRKLRDDLQRHFRVDQGAGQVGPVSKRTANGNVRFAVEPDAMVVRQEGRAGLPPPIPTRPATEVQSQPLSESIGTPSRGPTPPAASQIDQVTSQPGPRYESQPRAETTVAEALAPPPPYLHEPPLVRTISAPAIVEETAAITPALAVDTSKLEDMEDEITCPICMSIMVAVHAVAPCGHTMCGGCGDEWFRDKDTCPICRTSTSTPHMVPLLPMDRMIDMYVRAQGEDWEGLQGWKDRRGAWEALKVVIKEEEDQRRASSTQTPAQDGAGPMIPDIPGGLSLSGWLDGEEEYRLRDDESFGNPFFGHLLDEVSVSTHEETHGNGGVGPSTSSPNFASTSPGMGMGTGMGGWTSRFSIGDFERPSFPAPGVNPFMDAFGYTSHPPYTPRAQRTFSLPGLSGPTMNTNPMRRPILDGPRGWLSGMMDLVDTFTRHDHQHQHQHQRHTIPQGQAYRRVGARGPGDLDGLEEGMARMFAELRRGR